MDLQKLLSSKQKLIKILKLNRNTEIEYPPPTNNEFIRKQKGIYYTPKEITSYICIQTISSYILKLLNQEEIDLYQYLKYSTPQELQKLLFHLEMVKILDPACGAGVFLIEAAEILFQLKKFILKSLKEPINEHEIKCKILLNNIYGVDLFRDAVQNTKTRLIGWSNSNSGLNSDFKSLSILDWNIRLGNSLIGFLNEDLGTFELKNIHNRDLELNLQQLLKKFSPKLKSQINFVTKLLQSKKLNDILEAFFILKKIQKENIESSTTIITKILHNIHDKVYQILNPIFIKSIPKVFSEMQSEFSLNEFVKHQPFHWQIDFGEIMNNGGFDIIIGNPPYVFIRGKNFSVLERTFFKAIYLGNYESLAKDKARQSRKINSYSLFILRSIGLLKKDHYLGFIIPNTILRTTTNDFIRQFILKNTYIQEIVDLAGDIFKGVTASTIIIFLQKTRDLKNRLTLIKFNISDLFNYQFNSHYINQIRFLNNPVLAFNIHIDSEFEQAFELMKQNTIELGFITREIIEGIVCRKKDNLFTDDPTHPLAKKLLRGKDIGRYQINWKPNQYIIYAVDTSITKNKLHRSRPQWVHEAPEKLLTQRIGGGVSPIQVAYDDSQYYTFASINNIIFRNPIKYENSRYLSKYILGILNSKLINAYYLLNYSNKSSLTVNISKTFLESLPIKKVDISTQKLISRIAEYIIFLYKHHKNKPEIIEFFDSYLLDSLIYEIYFYEHLETNLCEILLNYITTLSNTTSKKEKLLYFSEIMQKIQNNLSINQIINKIRKNQIVLKIENLFQKRVNLIQEKK